MSLLVLAVVLVVVLVVVLAVVLVVVLVVAEFVVVPETTCLGYTPNPN